MSTVEEEHLERLQACIKPVVPKSQASRAGWLCLTCGHLEVEGAAGWPGAVRQGTKHSETHPTHELVVWSWRTMRIVDGLPRYA